MQLHCVSEKNPDVNNCNLSKDCQIIIIFYSNASE